MRIVFGLDPGTRESAVVIFNGTFVQYHDIKDNATMLEWLRSRAKDSVLVIEQVESFGMAVGREVFETVFASGQFAEAWTPGRFDRMPRRIVKQHICHTARATDANIRTELIDRFGGVKAIGTKKDQGPLYGIKSHCWAALAIAVTWYDLNGHLPDDIRPGVKPDF